MRSNIKLGHIAGIEIGLHFSWFIIAFLIAFSLEAHFRAVRPHWSDAVVWGVSIGTSVLFFVTLLLHELAHSLVAKSRGLKVRAITLFALGGVSQIESEATDAGSEFWIAIVGPLTSLVIGFVLLGIVRGLGGGVAVGSEPVTPLAAVLLWLGYINILLAGFNMIPGFPLDGGRVFRAIVWWITKKPDKSTRIAAKVGEGVALLFIVYGLFMFFIHANFGGLWLGFIGWFLLEASRSSYAQVGIMAGLRDHRVSELMESDCTQVEGYLSLRDFVDHYLLHSPSRCFVVAQDNHVAGIVTPNEVRGVSRENWGQTSVQSVMKPLGNLRTVPPDMPAVQAVELMSRENLNQLAVVSDGKLLGIFSRGQILRFLQLHSGMGEDSHNAAA
ncbi:MAG TPA: site-2 protease family protein [Verrucomicrobiae bacterium]|nr:site-2 protease family protein [Verrucomicrobiae bacterium]